MKKKALEYAGFFGASGFVGLSIAAGLAHAPDLFFYGVAAGLLSAVCLQLSEQQQPSQ